ncbi:MAG: insulinase family protein [Nitrospirae bacterium]|nr:insulinase family protein [Nitrospirota bacterium]
MRNKKIKNYLFFLFVLLVTCHLSLVTLSSAHAAIEIKKEVLENGLTLLGVERHNLPIVMVTVGIKAGAVVEPEGKAGLANLTAEILTEGTKKRTANEISEEIEFIGASLDTSGGDDYIVISLSILKKDLKAGIDILSDIILNPSFSQDEINKKKKQIKGSLRGREEDPGFIASREFRKAVFGTHPYGRMTEGSPETIDIIGQADLLGFHSNYYTPNNAVISIVGDITMGEAKGLLKNYFSGWQKKETKKPLLDKPKQIDKKTVITVNKDITQANIMLGHLGISRDNPDYYDVMVMNYILGGGGFSSRLMQNIRDEKGLAYDVHSFFDARKEAGSFYVGLQTKNESAQTAIEEALKEINRIRSVEVSDTEVNNAKAFLKGSFPMKIETSRKIANFILAVESYGLGLDYISRYPAYIDSVTKESVLRAAKKYLAPERLILVVVAKEGKASLNELK